MIALYNFLSGPMVWISFFVFFLGMLIKFLKLLFEVIKKESYIFSVISLKYSLRSVFMWLIPFGTKSMRNNFSFTFISFIFHFCIIISPIFLSAHIIMIDEAWNISWWSIPDKISDILAIVVIICCLLFALRRLFEAKVKYVTSTSDFVLLFIVAAPFITGFLAYHQIFNYKLIMILHILSGEVLIITIVFTRLSHMLLGPFTRAYMGSEFGRIRHAKDW